LSPVTPGLEIRREHRAQLVGVLAAQIKLDALTVEREL
jgi:hypothetical protein